jgi:hypothetical protein
MVSSWCFIRVRRIQHFVTRISCYQPWNYGDWGFTFSLRVAVQLLAPTISLLEIDLRAGNADLSIVPHEQH